MTVAEQLFLAMAGTIFGALFGGMISWSRSVYERRQALALQLYAEFHAPAFNHVRILAHRALESAPDLPAAYARSVGDEKDAVSSIAHFWEKVALLWQAHAIDRRLAAQFFAQYARWWRDLLCRGEGHADDEWGQTVTDIDQVLDRLIRKGRRKGTRR